MSTGEVCKATSTVISEAPPSPVTPLDLPDPHLQECCFNLPALAKAAGGTDFENDMAPFLYFYGRSVSASVLKLQKEVNGTMVDIANLDDNTYGEFLPFGFHRDELRDLDFIGYQLLWKNVLAANGEGCYRVRTDETLLIGGSNSQYSNTYELLAYTAERANESVRFEYYLNGIIGNKDNYKDTIDFGSNILDNGLGWKGQLRVPGIFGEESSPEFVREYVRFTNGQNQYIQNDQTVEWLFGSDAALYPACVHRLLKVDILQADLIFVTDYNNTSAEEFINVCVDPTSPYEPNWHRGVTKNASIELTFTSNYDNLRKKRC